MMLWCTEAMKWDPVGGTTEPSFGQSFSSSHSRANAGASGMGYVARDGHQVRCPVLLDLLADEVNQFAQHWIRIPPFRGFEVDIGQMSGCEWENSSGTDTGGSLSVFAIRCHPWNVHYPERT
jgi:hypothetical protein